LQARCDRSLPSRRKFPESARRGFPRYGQAPSKNFGRTAAHECNRSSRPTDKRRLCWMESRSTSDFDRQNRDKICERSLARELIAWCLGFRSESATNREGKFLYRPCPSRAGRGKDQCELGPPRQRPPPAAATSENSP